MTNPYQRFAVPESRLMLDSRQVQEFTRAARKHYSPQLPYHNWDNHVLETIAGVEVIAKKLRAKGVRVAMGALTVAAAWHDAGYYEKNTGYATKEAYSAALLEDYLFGKGVSDYERDVMRRAILATWHGHKELRKPDELILHRADIANLGGPTDAFLAHNVHIWQEHAVLNDAPISWEQHVANSRQFVRFSVVEHERESARYSLTLNDTTIDANNLVFNEQALVNIRALGALTDPSLE